ncbi:hypothetical protein TL16_g03284 [Triparma laevis f. inornata]|uniref:Uncharacterized protein n=2 Tax=Triparma laevis TaxID=1534972 RepID=A0A9W6ZSE1_9STRA|nr:hypothetical protein TrLO_g5804 [Triparma laevis f. longispina]GMH61571.1 hypothetical protein TL16_g03284 [Triparma laevis f. inornata]
MSFLTWLETTASSIKQTKLKVAGLYVTLSVLLCVATYLGTNLLVEHNFSSVYQAQKATHPSPLTTPFTLGQTSSVIHVTFPSETTPSIFPQMLHSLTRPAEGTETRKCAWLTSGSSRGEPSAVASTWLGPQTTGGGYASITKKNDPISRLTLSIRYPDTFETLCPEGKCMITAPFGQCDVFDKKCIYFWTIEEPITRIIGLYNVRCKTYGSLPGIGYKFASDKEGEASCPDISIYDFAKKIGNAYTKEFSLKYMKALQKRESKCDMDEGGSYDEECTPTIEPTTDYMYHKAYMEVMKNVIVFPLNDATRGIASLSYLLGVHDGFDVNEFRNRYEYSGVPESWNKNDKYFVPTAKQRSKLGKILQHDVKLYNRAMELYESEYKGWKPDWK